MNTHLPTMEQAPSPWVFLNYKRAASSPMIDITYHGLELTVQLDHEGYVEAVMATSDGTDVFHDFNAETIEELATAAKAAQMGAA
nr:hypothetical protein [uncultured Rhodoferax sp.]